MPKRAVMVLTLSIGAEEVAARERASKVNKSGNSLLAAAAKAGPFYWLSLGVGNCEPSTETLGFRPFSPLKFLFGTSTSTNCTFLFSMDLLTLTTSKVSLVLWI